ncbi:LOW QUALITY PROTEIN: hypothetical protein ACHAXT_007732 [Thalassiosira profunda]
MAGAAPPPPGAGAGGFPSPSITAHPHLGMEAIEDMLLEGHEATSSPTAALARTLDTASDNSGGGKRAPTVPGTKAASSAIAKDTSYPTTNAVHMQLQENAKLPTFNLPVDRSNASWKTPTPRGRRSQRPGRRGGRHRSMSSCSGDSGSMSSGAGAQAHISRKATPASTAAAAPSSPLPKLAPHVDEHGPMDSATSRTIEDILLLNDHDMNLSEMFLDGRSKSLAYSYTPQQWPQPPKPTVASKAKLGSVNMNNGSANAATSHAALLHNRRIPLPIPKLKQPSPPRAQVAAAAAIATAAALATEATTTPDGMDIQTAAALSCGAPSQNARSTASTIGTSDDAPKSNVEAGPCCCPKVAHPAGTTPLSGTLVPNPMSAVAPPPAKGVVLARTSPVKPHQYPPGYPYAAQAQARARQLAAHAKTKASIAHATVQRSKFGFGGDHRVPGVPAPPPSVSGRSAGPGAAPPATSVSDDANLPEKVGNVIAYERKKQRAKDARVKLNDAIEELAVAIDLAGSQSKERFNYVSKTTGTNSGHITHGQPPSGPPQHPLARLMDETIQQASDAKKWDRPTFVGLAANVIHSLNAQCEGLMREVAQLRKVAIANGTAADFSELQYNPSGTPVPGQAAKRQKLGLGKARQQFHAATLSPSGASQVLKDQQTRLIIRLALETPNVLKNAASYLDARSLSRSLCVSKRWRIQNIFQNPNLWLDLCVKRFGASATRKWQEADENQHRTNAVLYRAMGEKNVKPYCPKEGTLALGGASLDGLVSCWVSLMDRSNGETYRSVRQIKTQGGETRESYGSLPVVELRLLVQNTGHAEGAIIVPDQEFCVDASTRRKGEKMLEVNSDDRFKRQVLHIERRPSIDGKPVSEQDKPLTNELCHLGLFESAVISVHVHARACSTTTKFCQRSKRMQLLVSIDGTTRPIPIPFHCTNEHPLKPNFH